MYHILLSLIAIGAPLDCDHASELIDSARNNPDKSEQLEIVRVVIAHTDPMCFKDAKAFASLKHIGSVCAMTTLTISNCSDLSGLLRAESISSEA